MHTSCKYGSDYTYIFRKLFLYTSQILLVLLFPLQNPILHLLRIVEFPDLSVATIYLVSSSFVEVELFSLAFHIH